MTHPTLKTQIIPQEKHKCICLGLLTFSKQKNLYCSAKIRIPVMEILFTYFRRADDSRYEKLISNIKGTVKRLDQETYFMPDFVFLELRQTLSLINISNKLT